MVFSVHTFTLKRFLEPDVIPEHILVWGEQNKVTPYKTMGNITTEN